MRVLVMTVPESPYLTYLRARIPQLEVVTDTTRSCLDTFIAQLDVIGPDPALRMQDDIILTMDFLAKATQEIHEHPTSVIQFFSMRADDVTVGSRWDRSYMMNQCCYLPHGYAVLLAEFAPKWRAKHPEHPNADDTMLNDWLRSRKEQYWLSVPSLVQHRVAKSRLGARSSKRQSPTFADPDGSDPWLV